MPPVVSADSREVSTPGTALLAGGGDGGDGLDGGASGELAAESVAAAQRPLATAGRNSSAGALSGGVQPDDFLMSGRGATLAGRDQLAAVPELSPIVKDSAAVRRLRTAGFLILHTASVATMIMLIANFVYTEDFKAVIGLSTLFFFSGCFCAHAAWHCEAPEWAPKTLPLKKQSGVFGFVLMIPYGFLQGVVIVLALEDFTSRSTRGRQRQDERIGAGVSTKPASNKFHCKAVIGIFEGLFSAGISFYQYWTMDYPVNDPITHSRWVYERQFLAVACWVLAVSAGLGLLELDFCVSRQIARMMQRSLMHELLHVTFRTCEVFMRMCLYVWFTVALREADIKYWFGPIVADCLTTGILVVIFGGNEPNYFVRVLCSGPCLFANIFLFIDSPYKRRAANRLSFWLAVRNIVAMIAMPTIGLLSIPNRKKELGTEWQGHGYMIAMNVGMVPIYFILGWFLAIRKGGSFSHDIPDIYSACQKGDADEVERCMLKLTHSAVIGLNTTCADVDGWTMLMLAAHHGHAEVCRLLLQKGANPRIRITDDTLRRCLSRSKSLEWTAVHMAADRGHSDVLEVLVQAAATDSGEAWRDERGNTPLHVAACSGHVEASRVLASRRPAWLRLTNHQGQTPLDLARSEVREVLEMASSSSALASCEMPPMTISASSNSNRNETVPLRAGVQAPLSSIEEEWTAITLKIAKASTAEVEKIAPGLCSYIAGSCGGALGRIFLANAPQENRVASASDVAGSIISQTGSQLPFLLDDEAGPGISFGSFAAEERPVTIEDLEPIDSNGETSEAWRTAVKRRNEQGGTAAYYVGLTVQNIKMEAAEALLGEGTYGIVWRAIDRRHQAWYAVKTIKTWHGHAPPQATRECEVADRIMLIPHPCIVSLFSVCNYADVGIYAMVMEFATNGDLLGVLSQRKKHCYSMSEPYRPPADTLKWIAQIFLGLEHMHRRMDTLLRDLKPDNVVMDRHHIAKLTDFGFGRFGCESRTGVWSFGVPTGSPGYVAPEILRGKRYDFKADLYSFGVLVWVILTGGLKDNPMWVCRFGHRVSQQQRDASAANADEGGRLFCPSCLKSGWGNTELSVETPAAPRPPTGPLKRRMDGSPDYSGFFNDCRELNRCIAEPERYKAKRLKDLPKEFVSNLVSENPRNRMDHDKIRSSGFFYGMSLPPHDAPPREVKAYIREMMRPPRSPSASAGAEAPFEG